MNQMWILKKSKELLDHLKSPNLNLITNIKSFDFSTLDTTIPRQKLKSRLTTIIRNSFLHKNGNRRYKYLVLGREGTYFVKEHSDSKIKYTEDDIIKMLEFLVDNIFVAFARKVFQQIIDISMGTADIFMDLIQMDSILTDLILNVLNLTILIQIDLIQMDLIQVDLIPMHLIQMDLILMSDSKGF